MFAFVNCSANSEFYDDYNKVVVVKMKDEINGVPIKEFAVLKPKMYKFLESDNSEHKVGVNLKNIEENVWMGMFSRSFKTNTFCSWFEGSWLNNIFYL